MAVNSYLIYEMLDKCMAKKLAQCTTQCNIKYVTIYNSMIAINSNTVYLVVDKDNFPIESDGENSLMIVLGKPKPEILAATEFEYICVEETYGLGKLYERLQEILEYYNKWEENLSEILLQGDIDELCKASVNYFGNPLTVQDDKFELLGVGENDDIYYPYQIREKESDFLSEEWIESAITHKKNIFSKKGPFEFHYIQKHSSLLLNIFERKNYKAQICVDANHKNITIEDYIRISILGKYVKKLILNENFSSNKLGDRFRTQFIDYAAGNETDKKVLEMSLEKYGWESEDFYISLIIKRKNNSMFGVCNDYFCKKWEEELKESISFDLDGIIYLLINISKYKDNQEDLENILQKKAAEYSCLIGKSAVFSDFFDCADYFSQAKAALKIGIQASTQSVVYEFEEYKLQYIIKYGISSLPQKTLMPRQLNELIEYDKEYQGDLCKTLIVYLKNNQNVTNCINQMYIHRSTFKYRIGRIKQLTGVDFDDKMEMLYWELILYEMENQLEEDTETAKVAIK